MPKISIKLCGLNSEDAVKTAAALKCDFAGFVIHPASARHISPARAGELKRLLTPGVASVAVLVTPEDALIKEVMHALSPDYLQLHGVDDAERMADLRLRLGVKLIQAIPVRGAEDLDGASAFYDAADVLLFDAQTPGGGKTFDWKLLEERNFPLPWFLSGGLNSANVAEALRITGARMVDISSGIESSPGVKDSRRMEAFVRAVRGAES